MPDARPGPPIQNATTKQPVFHGIGFQTAKKSGPAARRTGHHRASNKTSFRSLRHLNNARKIARRERSPDVTKIKLRSLAEWAELAPEDTNLQLPKHPASPLCLAEGGNQRSLHAGHFEAMKASGTQQAARPSGEAPPTRKLTYAFDSAGPPSSSSKKDMAAINRIDPYEGQERKIRTLANGRFFYFPGEILVDIKFGKAHIGDVRIRGLPNWAIGQIIKLKAGHKLTLEIGSNDVVTPAHWAQLCTGRSNVLQATGVIIPYQDTANTVSEMERYLHQHTLAALWYHPTEDFMLVFYSPYSSAWIFLERMGGLAFDESIRVLTRNKMPQTAVLAMDTDATEGPDAPVAKEPRRPSPPKLQTSSTLANTDDDDVSPSDIMTQSNNVLPPFCFSGSQSTTGPSITQSISKSKNQSPKSAYRSRLHKQLPSSRIHMVGNNAPDSALLPCLGSNSGDTQVVEAGSESFHLPLEPGQAIGKAIENTYQISYKYLTAIPASKNVDRNSAKARFYLVYPRTAQAELECLHKFLRSYTFHTNICTSTEERGWDAFRNIFKCDYIGVILVSYKIMIKCSS